jgi:type II secretory pathway predicted ATPase ExeA
MYKQRFGLKHTPFPKDAEGKNFFTEFDGYRRLERRFQMLCEEPGLGLLTGEPAVGKTTAIRNLAHTLPYPEYLVIYLCDTGLSPLEFYKTMASEISLTPAYRRGALWRQLKSHFLHLVDERGEHPLLIIDEAHHLSEAFFTQLSAFLNFAFDSRDLFTTWLVGQPSLRARLAMKHHAALRTRIVTSVRLDPFGSRETFQAYLSHGLEAAGATGTIISDSARELLFRASRGLPREVGKMIRKAMRFAAERKQTFLDDELIEEVIGEEVEL